MDFGEALRVVFRRWRLSLPILLIVLVATAAVAVKWPKSYQSTAEITLVGSGSIAAESGNGGNDYLASGSLLPVANVLATNLSSDQAATSLAALGVTDTFTAAVPATAGGPFIAFTVTGPSVANVAAEMTTILNFSSQQLLSLQKKAQPDLTPAETIRSAVIAQPSTATPSNKRRDELVAGVLVIGLLVVFLASVLAESRARRRRGGSAAATSRRRPDVSRSWADADDDTAPREAVVSRWSRPARQDADATGVEAPSAAPPEAADAASGKPARDHAR
jgi:hypothetical protein